MTMRSPEENRGIHQATTLPNRGRGNVGVAEPRTAPLLETPKTRKKKPNFVLRGLMTLGILTAGMGIAYEAYENIPAVHRTVDRALGRVSAEDVPNIFDNKLDSGAIEDNDTIKLSKQETKNRPKADENGKPILKFNFVPPAGKRIEYAKSFHGGFVHPGVEVDEKTTRNEMNLTLPAGTVITASMDGRVFIGSDLGNKKKDGLSITFMGQDGLLYRLGIVNEGIEDGIFQPLVNAPKHTDVNRNGLQWEEGFSASEDQGLVLVTKDVKVSMLLQGGLNGTLYGPRLESNLQFAIDSSGKLILPQV